MNHDLPPRTQQFSTKALRASFTYAWEGLVFVVRTQRNMRIHLFAALLVVIVGLCSDLSRDDWLWLILAMTLVITAELFNSALEYVCDVVMPQHHASVKRAKDIAAGAVLICACAASMIGVTILLF